MTDKQRKELKSIVKKVFLVDYSNNYIQYSDFFTLLESFCIKYNVYGTINRWIKNQSITIKIGSDSGEELFEYNILKEKRKLKIKSLHD